MPTVHHTLETTGPIQLYVEIGKGDVAVRAGDPADGTASRVELTGKHAEDVELTQDGDQVSIIAPSRRAGFFGGGEDALEVVVVAPRHSDIAVSSRSGDVVLDGEFAMLRLRTGSGDVRVDTAVGAAQIETGSGDILATTLHDELRLKTGSGDVQVEHCLGAAVISTGSGDVAIGDTAGALVVKTGSGDLGVDDAGGDVALTTGTGDLTIRLARRGRIRCTSASGDVWVAVAPGTPVWTDVSTLTGSIDSSLSSRGEPEPGSEHLEISATVVSGDILLREA